MRGAYGLGIINPGDHWLIDRKWGNPGTATIMKRPDGQWGLRGFGENMVTVGGVGTMPMPIASGKWECGYYANNGGWICSQQSFFERKSSWIAMGAVAAGILTGVLIGRATKRGRR